MEPLECFGRGTVHFLNETGKYAAIHELIFRTKAFAKLKNLNEFEYAVVSREEECCTGFGRGVAVAHGRTCDAETVSIALGISRQGIDYGSPDGNPVHLLFIIANPPESNAEYLSALSSLVMLLRDADFRDQLLRCRDIRHTEQVLYSAFSRQYRQKILTAGAHSA